MLIVQGVALAMAMWTMGAPGAASSSKDERVAAAYQQFEKQRHVEAALEFEGLWRDYKEPRFLFNAAVTRYTARHYAHAVAYLNEYLALAEVQGADREEAKAQLTVAQREVTTVKVRVQAEGVSEEPRVTARFVSTLSSDLRPQLPVRLGAAGAVRNGSIELDPGTWVLRAEAPGAEPAEVEVKVTSGAAAAADLSLKPVAQETGPKGQPGEAPSERPLDARKLGLATVGVGAGVAVAGAVVTAIGQAKGFGPALKADPASCVGWSALVDCSVALRRGATLRSAGAGVLGAGLGLVGSGAVWFARTERARRVAWAVELGVGGAALVGGIVGTVVAAGQFNAVNAAVPATWDGLQGGVKGPATIFTASSALAGLGVGLAAGAGLGLGLSRGRTTKYAKTLQFAGGPARAGFGLSLSGRF